MLLHNVELLLQHLILCNDLSSPSESTISSVSQVFRPSPFRSIHFQINDKMSQKAEKVTIRDEVNRGTAETGNLEQCTAIVCPLSGLEKYTGSQVKTTLPNSKETVMGEL